MARISAWGVLVVYLAFAFIIGIIRLGGVVNRSDQIQLFWILSGIFSSLFGFIRIMARKFGLSVDVFINESIITFGIGYSGVSDIMGVVFSHSFGSNVSFGHRCWAGGFCE